MTDHPRTGQDHVESHRPEENEIHVRYRRSDAMNVALTGSTGFIGSHLLSELQDHGHHVTALVRDDASADVVAARGATPAVVDLYDRAAGVSVLRRAGGAIPRASPRGANSAG